MAIEQTTDPRWTAKPNPNAFERFFLRRMRDERDLIFVHRCTVMSCILFPIAIGLYLLPGWWALAVAPIYVPFIFARFTGRYILMLHATCHLQMFKRKYRIWNHYIPWVLGPFFGSTPTSFYAHHIGMHHPENNMESDLSSTLGYRRDRFVDFLHYWARFFVAGFVHLTRYFRLRKRSRMAKSFLLGEVAWVVVVLGLLWLNTPATLTVFVFPMLLLRWFMMAGNFAQHAFVDVDDPSNPYRNSTCLTNTPYNHACYNDGYHIVHHVEPSMHWTEMAQWYDDNRSEFAAQDALVFSGMTNNQAIWWYLMTQNYDKLAQHVVNFKGRTHEEIVAWLQSRVRRKLGQPMGVFAMEKPTDSQRAA